MNSWLVVVWNISESVTTVHDSIDDAVSYMRSEVEEGDAWDFGRVVGPVLTVSEAKRDYK